MFNIELILGVCDLRDVFFKRFLWKKSTFGTSTCISDLFFSSNEACAPVAFFRSSALRRGAFHQPGAVECMRDICFVCVFSWFCLRHV